VKSSYARCVGLSPATLERFNYFQNVLRMLKLRKCLKTSIFEFKVVQGRNIRKARHQCLLW